MAARDQFSLPLRQELYNKIPQNAISSHIKSLFLVFFEMRQKKAKKKNPLQFETRKPGRNKSRPIVFFSNTISGQNKC